MLKTLALLLLMVVPQELVARDQCDTVDVNSYFDDCGKMVFVQAIYIDWKHDHEEIVAWRLIKAHGQRPQKESGGYVSRWMDGERMREVWCRDVRESWTQHDPELLARDTFPKECRRELRK